MSKFTIKDGPVDDDDGFKIFGVKEADFQAQRDLTQVVSTFGFTIYNQLEEAAAQAERNASASNANQGAIIQILGVMAEPKIKMKKKLAQAKESEKSAIQAREAEKGKRVDEKIKHYTDRERDRARISALQKAGVTLQKALDAEKAKNNNADVIGSNGTGRADEFVPNDIDVTSSGRGGSGMGMGRGKKHSYVRPPSPKYPGQTKDSIVRRLDRVKGVPKGKTSSRSTGGKRKRVRKRESLSRTCKKAKSTGTEKESSKKE